MLVKLNRLTSQKTLTHTYFTQAMIVIMKCLSPRHAPAIGKAELLHSQEQAKGLSSLHATHLAHTCENNEKAKASNNNNSKDNSECHRKKKHLFNIHGPQSCKRR